MATIDKARFWTAVLYPENMREDWEETIGDIVQQPYVYCKHNRDKDSKSEHRKDHVHIILAFPNTTTYSHALNVFDLLSAEGKKALNTCQAVIGIRNMYDYLIHDTETSRKQKKELYDSSERIAGNGFDIGAYEQIGLAEKNEIFLEMSKVISEKGFTTYVDFFDYVVETYDDINYIEIMRAHSGHFDRMTRGNWQRFQRQNREIRGVTTTDTHAKFCPECGSVDVRKEGKTAGGTQRFKCKDCGKKFI